MDKEKTALLLIDLQKEGGTSNVVGMDGIVEKTSKLIEQCRQEGIPIIYTRHLNRGDAIALANREPLNEKGEPAYYHTETTAIEVIDELKPEAGDIIINKYRYSAFHESSLDLMLKGLGIKHLIIAGVLTDVCVISTAMDAYYRDYQINLVKDLCGTTTEGAHMAATLMMANWIYDIEIYDAEQLGNKLLGKAYGVWRSSQPDEVQFTPENIREVFRRLTVV